MGLLWIINFVLLSIPIGATLGVLLGIQSHRAAAGEEPLFQPAPPGPGEAPDDDRITVKAYCNETIGISPPSQGDHYTLNPNPWGWVEGEAGSICLNVTTFNNQTYPTKTTAPEFSVTWEYPQGPETAPVHAFPNVKVDNQVFPATIKDLKGMVIDLEWTYGVGKEAVDKTDEAELTASEVNANVAIDIFLDSDKEQSQESSKANWEIMVWLAAFGPATQPIGLAEGDLKTQEVNGTEFKLYFGQNGLGQNVLSWVADKYTEKFHGDIAPLIQTIAEMDDPDYPKAADYMGYMSMGTEAYSSADFVTFHVPMLSIDVEVES
jgi:hypothetical protein